MASAEPGGPQRFLTIRFEPLAAPRRFSSATTVAGIGRHPHALACATCQATQLIAVARAGIGWASCHPGVQHVLSSFPAADVLRFAIAARTQISHGL